MRVRAYSHQGGEESVSPQIRVSLVEKLQAIGVRPQAGNIRDVRSAVRTACTELGFSGKVTIHPSSKISIEGVRGRTGLCLQTGNVARMYADLLKVQLLYVEGHIDCSVMIVLDRRAAKVLGGNLANWERLTSELVIFEPVITAPTLVLGLGGDE